MGSKKLLVTGAAIAVVAAAAIIVPSVASGVPLVRVLPATAVVAPDESPGGQGEGKAWGHRKDDPAFPGDNGNAWGHHKDSPGFPGNGNGRAWGHHKDSPDFPGHNGDDQNDE
ncbi:hypothetical protein [Microbacterium sp. LWH3-1.2]|uniref:hypothetical protein n=1 Tax=Microbacterium sp. LWH3-1.2 TaxID=3135256 RepID=UPI0034332F2D